MGSLLEGERILEGRGQSKEERFSESWRLSEAVEAPDGMEDL